MATNTPAGTTYRISYTVEPSAPLARALAGGGAGLLREPVRAFLARLGADWKAEAQRRAPRDLGDLAKSHYYRTDSPGPGRVPSGVTVGATSPYALFVHGSARDNYTWGRRPGAKMPPPSALLGWAERHGFDTTPGSLYLLARKIARDGIKARPWLKETAEAGIPDVAHRRVPALARAIEAAWASEGGI